MQIESIVLSFEIAAKGLSLSSHFSVETCKLDYEPSLDPWKK